MVRFALGLLVLVLFLGCGTAVRVWTFAHSDDRSPADVILVFGAAEYNGRPSKILAARLDHAKTLFQSGVAAHIVTVGGKEAGDEYTEAQVGGTYLNRAGVPAEDIIEVNAGRDTLSSAQAAAEMLTRRGWHSAVLVSDPWHVLRARTMARDAGIDAWASPVRSGPSVTQWSTQLPSIGREVAALLYYRLTSGSADAVERNHS